MSSRIQVKYISALLFLVAAVLFFVAASLSLERKYVLVIVGFMFISVSVMSFISSKEPKKDNS